MRCLFFRFTTKLCSPPPSPSSSQVVLTSENRRYRSADTCVAQAATDGLVDCDQAGDPNSHDMDASRRKAAGCFRRQINLLRSLDRFSTPLPQLEPEVSPETSDCLCRQERALL